MKSNDLIHRYLQGIATDGEVRELDERMLCDETIQDEFLLQAELDTHLRQEAQLGSTEGGQPIPGPYAKSVPMAASQNSQRLQTRNRVLLAIAVVALIAVFTPMLLLRQYERGIITIVALSGPLEWTGDGGRVQDRLAVGERLPGGTLELLAPDSWIQFEFHDLSTVTLTGLSEVTITEPQNTGSEQKQKELHLRHGRLSASVRTQPSGQPMLVHTPSAELQVLGTQFDVEAIWESTQLTVNEGRVRLKRRIDGEEVDVPAWQSVTVSMEDQNGFSLSERRAPVTVWQSDLRVDVVRGKWLSKLWVLRTKLKQAVARHEMTEEAAAAIYNDAANLDDATGSVWALSSPFGSLVALSPRRSVEQPVVLNNNTRIRVRGRLHSPVGLRVGLSVFHPQGGFAGKHSTRVSAEEASNADGELMIDLPITRFRDAANSAGSPLGNELVDLWCVAESSAAKFEITSVEVMDQSVQD